MKRDALVRRDTRPAAPVRRNRTRFGWRLLLAVAVLPVTLAWGQQPAPQPPEAPTAVDTPDVPSAESHIRRHRMTREAKIRAEFEAKVKAQSARLRERIAALQAEVEALPADVDPEIRRQQEDRLRLLEEQLRDFESGSESGQRLEIDIPAIELPDLDSRSVVVTPGGETIIRLRPEGARPWRKKHGTKVAIFEPVYVDANDWVDGGAVSIFDHVHVSGHVNEDVVSVGGNVYVTGSVGGNVVAPFGDVYLDEDAVVEGDVVSIELFDEGGIVGGRIEEVSLPRLPWSGTGVQSFFALLATVAISIAILAVLLGLLALAAVPDNVQRVEDRLRRQSVGSFLGGLLVQVLAFTVWLLLVVTVIGIPIAFLALPLILLAAKLLGFVAICRIVGGAVRRGEESVQPGWLTFLLGALLLHAPLFVGLALRSAGGEFAGRVAIVGNLLIFLGLSVLYLATTAGIGAAVFARLGARPRKKNARGTAPSPVTMPPPPRAGEMPGPPDAAPNAT